MKLNGPARDV